MKKVFLPIITLCSLLMTLSPMYAMAAGLVPCDGVNVKCEWKHVVQILTNILNFIINDIVLPLGTLAIIIGAVMLLISAGNPNLASNGKKIIFSAIIGLILALCTRLIINWILDALGYLGGRL